MAEGPRETRPLGTSGPAGGDAWVSSRNGRSTDRRLSAPGGERLRKELVAALEEAVQEASEVIARYDRGVGILGSLELEGDSVRERSIALHQFEEAIRLRDEARSLLTRMDSLSPVEALEALDRCPPARLLGALHPLHGFHDHFFTIAGCAGLFPPPRPGEGGGIGTRRLRAAQQPAGSAEPADSQPPPGLWARLRRWLGG